MEQVAQEHPFTNPPVETLRITGTSGRYSKGGATNLDNGIDLHSGQGMRVALGTASPKRPGAEAAPGTVSPKRPGAEAAPGTTSPKQPGAEEVAVLEGIPDGGEAVQALHAIRDKADGRQLEPVVGGADGRRHGSFFLVGVRPAGEEAWHRFT